MKSAVALCLLMHAVVASAEPPLERPVHAYAGISVVGALPQGEELSEVYGLGAGIGVEVGLEVRQALRFAVGVAPAYSSGDPVTGPLASGSSAKLWTVPLSASIQFVLSRWPAVRPYLGAGLSVHYMHEKLAFQGPIGEREQARSYAPVGVQAQIGIEQNRPRRFFGELWLTKAKAGGVDGGDLAREVGGFQIRLGYRGQLW